MAPIITTGLATDSSSTYYYDAAPTFMGLSKMARLISLEADRVFYNMFLELSTEESCGLYSCKLAHIATHNTVYIWNEMGCYTNYIDTDYIFAGKLDEHGGDVWNHFDDFVVGVPEVIRGVFGENVEIKELSKKEIEDMKARYLAQSTMFSTLGLRAELNKNVCELIGAKMLPDWLLKLDVQEISSMVGVMHDYDAARNFKITFYDTGLGAVPEEAYGSVAQST